MTQRRRPTADNRRRAQTGQTVNIEERRRSAGSPSGNKKVSRGSGGGRTAPRRSTSAYGTGTGRTAQQRNANAYRTGTGRTTQHRSANTYGTGYGRTAPGQRDRPQSSGKPQKKKRVRKRRKIPRKIVAAIVLTILCIGGLGYLETVIFQTKSVEVTGNTYTPAQEIETWLKQDKYFDNSLYLLWKYNQKDAKKPPSVESMKLSMQSPRKIRVNVTEKTYAGRIDSESAYLYFDKDGIACLRSDEVIEGVPYVEGMEIDEEKVVLGETVPVSDSEVFGRINEACALLAENELTPDRISCSGTDLTLYFGAVRVQIGSDKYEERIAQIPPVLAKLNELYSGQAGILHLENYDSADSSIRFVPDTQ